jgi:hypothetical protein
MIIAHKFHRYKTFVSKNLLREDQMKVFNRGVQSNKTIIDDIIAQSNELTKEKAPKAPQEKEIEAKLNELTEKLKEEQSFFTKLKQEQGINYIQNI